MNRNLAITCIVATLAIVAIACGSKKETSTTAEATPAAAEPKEWKEMDDFHMIMAEAFHPFKDSANLAPAKAKAAEMAIAAETWANAPLPEKVNNNEVKEKLQHLKTETTSFVTTAKSTDDKAVGEALTKLHDLFHELQEAWYGGGEHHH
ncbi:hypothetical protein [Chryseolinea lacunae]|uniref:Uncharacterized protein n=1 Tax=Chryseolinea lacunae TaxID=2801331 RepID=A0ABS1KVW9_9BACT|nr:hypothetical protein [Chryseolinea lacunae]MBL0743468.1 hypothetical protein [Chryseolinea lacunae]